MTLDGGLAHTLALLLIHDPRAGQIPILAIEPYAPLNQVIGIGDMSGRYAGSGKNALSHYRTLGVYQWNMETFQKQCLPGARKWVRVTAE